MTADEKVSGFETQYRSYWLELVSVRIVCTVRINVAEKLHIGDIIIGGGGGGIGYIIKKQFFFTILV